MLKSLPVLSSRHRVHSNSTQSLHPRKPLLNVETLLEQQQNTNRTPLSITGQPNFLKLADKHSCRKLIILDWDDTINASSWCMKSGVLTLRAPNHHDLHAVRDLSVTAAKTLIKCMEHGHVVIVTNAEAGWVEISARALLPEVYRLCQSQSHLRIFVVGY